MFLYVRFRVCLSFKPFSKSKGCRMSCKGCKACRRSKARRRFKGCLLECKSCIVSNFSRN